MGRQRSTPYEAWLKRCLAPPERQGGLPAAEEREPGWRGVIPATHIVRAIHELSTGGAPASSGLRCSGYTVVGDLHLEGVIVPFALFLERCRFRGDLHLWRMTAKTVCFDGSVFERGMDIRGAEINGNFLMRRTTALGPVIARDMKIHATAEFLGAKFLYDGDNPSAFKDAAQGNSFGFSRSTASALYWRDLGAKPRGQVVLRDATVGAFVHDLNEAPPLRSWPDPGNLILEGFRYDRLEKCPVDRAVAWLKLQPEFSESAYSALARAYQNLNLIQSAEDILALLKKHEISKIKSPTKRWFNYAIYGVTGYGQKPERAFTIFIALFIMHFSMVAYAAHYGLMRPVINDLLLESCFYGSSDYCDKDIESWRKVSISGLPRFLPPSYPDVAPFSYALESFVPIFQFNQRRYWEPQSFSLRVLLSTLAGLGLFLGGLFVGAITGFFSPKLKSDA